jgi:hypothetical protein
MSGRKRQQETGGTKPTKKTKSSSKDDLNMVGHIWENRLSKEEYQVLDKAFEDYCKTINITKKDFFLKINE